LTGSGGTVYSWAPATGLDNPAVQDPVTTLFHDQSYILTVKNVEGCGEQDTINIKVYKGPEIYLPNAFTPNGDGRNDSFKVIGPGIRKLNYFRIYNRWGQLIFESNSLKTGWDGSFRGSPQPAGVFAFTVSAEDSAGKTFSKSGSFLLIR
jgi:gliding motility-associated-like protein